MAEQHKESSSADSKDKSSLLDEDIGKEFLSSWKSISMADDEAMDFGFGTVSKGNKKTFDFGKLDMNFNLDGEFNKISSFKVDMSDIDFTCPPKKSSSKDKNGESSGAKAGKQDGFKFSFDFNELDSFNLDSSIMKGDASSNSNLSKKAVTAEGVDNVDAKKPETNDDESAHASNDSMDMKRQASKSHEILKVETLVGNPSQDGSVSKFSSSRNLDNPIENQTSDTNEIIPTEERDQERDLSDRTKSTQSISEQVIITAHSQSVGQSDSEQNSIPEQVSLSGDKQKVNDKVTCMDSDGVDLQLEHSSLLRIAKSDNSAGETMNLGGRTQGGTYNPQPEKGDKSLENIAKTDALKMISCDNDVRENKKSILECHLTPAISKPSGNKTVLLKDKEPQGMQSNIVNRPVDKYPSSASGTKGISFGSQKNGDINLRSITQARSNGTRFGSKLASGSLPGSSKLTRDATSLLGSKDDLKSFSNTREGIVSDVMPSNCKLAGKTQLFCQEFNKSKAILPGTVMSTKDGDILSSQVNPSCFPEKTARNTTQMSVNSEAEVSGKESSQKSRITSLEGNKLASFKACKIAPALSGLKTLRNFEANRVLATNLHKKETNSSVRSEQSVEILGTKASKVHLTDSGDNQKPMTPSLKRKTNEGSEADLTSWRSLKRLSQSPSISRNFKESSEVIEQIGSKLADLSYNHSSSGLEESLSEIEVTEMEVSDSLLMEDNSNVEKAEAYMKELEDICNMLKKKHEEAKELLVRAIVNDNNLLMLNHPIYEEKIQKVQRFASQLISKRIQT